MNRTRTYRLIQYCYGGENINNFGLLLSTRRIEGIDRTRIRKYHRQRLRFRDPIEIKSAKLSDVRYFQNVFTEEEAIKFIQDVT